MLVLPTLNLINETSGTPRITIKQADAFKLLEQLTQALAYCTLLEANGSTPVNLKMGSEIRRVILEVQP